MYAPLSGPVRVSYDGGRTWHAAVSGFGAAPIPCGANASQGIDKACYCNSGFDWVSADSIDCAPIDVTKPCAYTGQQHNPVDKKCECPPGMHVDPSPSGTACIPLSWFPNCVDASGNSVPNCFMGQPMKDQLIAAGVGALLGAGAALLIRRYYP